MIKTLSVNVNERALVFKKNVPVEIRETGIYRMIGSGYTFLKYDISKYAVLPPSAEKFVDEYPDVFKNDVSCVSIGETECGLVYKNGLLTEILDPAQNIYFWKTNTSFEIRKVDLSESYEVDKSLKSFLIEAHKKGKIENIQTAITVVEVKDVNEAVLTVDGKVEGVLSSGVYAFWRYNRHVAAYIVDLRLQNLDVVGQEILTKDKVSIRTNISANYKITDIRTVFESFPSYKDYIYKELQFALREACGLRTLEDILSAKDDIKTEVMDYMTSRTKLYGIDVKDVGIKDIILPGDMKLILNKVVEAEKVAQANNIKRREETAATRSLHNTAKMLENNPTLMRLKELEVLEKVTEKIDKITVSSGLEGILTDLIKIKS